MSLDTAKPAMPGVPLRLEDCAVAKMRTLSTVSAGNVAQNREFPLVNLNPAHSLRSAWRG